MPSSDSAPNDPTRPEPASSSALGDLPPDRLRCPMCDYRLFGLRVPRCPECGFVFHWDDVRAAVEANTDLLEHRFRRESLRALVRTWYRAAFWPERVWHHLPKVNRPSVVPLVVFVLLQMLVFATGWDVVARAADPLMNAMGRWMDSSRASGLWSFMYAMQVNYDFLPRMLAWHLATFAFMLMLGRSAMATPGRWRHILRIYAHATAFAALCPALWCICEATLDFSMFFRSVPLTARPAIPFDPAAYVYLGQGMFATGVFVTWLHLRLAYRSYLNVPYAGFASAVVLAAGYLLADLAMTLLAL